MRYAIMNPRSGYRMRNGSVLVFTDPRDAMLDMRRQGDQLIPLPRLGQSPEFMEKIRGMKK